jgi:hypothetical protein
MRKSISGKILEANEGSIPGATVYVSNSKGAIASTKVRMKTDVEGNYSLPVSFPYINPITGKLTMMRIGTHLTVKYQGLKDLTVPIDFNSNEPYDITLFPRTQEFEDVIVTSTGISEKHQECLDKGGKYTRGTKDEKGNVIQGFCTLPLTNKEKCQKQGGIWDDATKSCKLPSTEEEIEATWWQRNRIPVILGGIAVIGTGVLIVIAMRKKN